MLSNQKKRERFEERAAAMRARSTAPGRLAADRARKEDEAFERMGHYLEASARRMKQERYVTAIAGVRTSSALLAERSRYMLGGVTPPKLGPASVPYAFNRGGGVGRIYDQAA